MNKGMTIISTAMSGQDHSKRGPNDTGMSKHKIAAANSVVPSLSTLEAFSEKVFGISEPDNDKMSRHTGMFTKNTLRQPNPNRSADTNQPPSTWPVTKDKPPMAL